MKYTKDNKIYKYRIIDFNDKKLQANIIFHNKNISYTKNNDNYNSKNIYQILQPHNLKYKY